MKTNKIEILVNLFFENSRLIRKRVSDCRGRFDHLSWLQLHALGFVEDNKPTVGELSSFLKIARPSATSMVNNLVKQNFVKKNKEEKDGRSVRLVILPAGKKFLKDGQAKIMVNLKPILSRLTDTELSNFIDIHRHLQGICKLQ